jgi:hypothetical protein
MKRTCYEPVVANEAVYAQQDIQGQVAALTEEKKVEPLLLRSVMYPREGESFDDQITML